MCKFGYNPAQYSGEIKKNINCPRVLAAGVHHETGYYFVNKTNGTFFVDVAELF